MATKSEQPSKQIDWLWAAILERKMAYHYTLMDMADIAGTNYERMRRYITQSPWTWPMPVLARVTSHFGIRIIQKVEGQPGSEQAV